MLWDPSAAGCGAQVGLALGTIFQQGEGGTQVGLECVRPGLLQETHI